MAKIEIELTEEQDRRLKDLAAKRKQPKDVLVRRAIDRMLGLNPGRPRSADDPEWLRSIDAVGRFPSGHRDVARRHDAYLGDDKTGR